MTTTRIKKTYLLILTTFGILVLATIATPFSVSFSFDAGGSLTPNIAYAQTPCGVGDTRTVLADGKIQCTGILSTVVYNSDGSRVATLSDGTTISKDAQGNTTIARTTSCASVLSYMTSPFTCMFRSLMSLTAATVIYISTWILSIAGLLFNWLMDHTIIQFGTFYGTIKNAIETAWTAFRDIANIAIIGIFTFIAISIILGLKEYGQKRLIANVLIIAALINFSLLFTKMIIDVSNYTAAQIYTAAALGGNATSQGGAVGATVSKYGIADQYMNLLGVGTFANAYKTVNDIGEAQDSGWATLGHGLMTMVVVLAAAMVLFYGCFLLVSRMIMLIFLMVTGAIAFASYLIPKWSGSSYGWTAWWDSLLWCATFAPMLMFFLWVTLNVSNSIKGTSDATLGVALSNPTTSSIGALFTYVLILGLFFATFKLSSMWANKIGGFSMAALAPALGIAGAGRLAGLLGKNTIGLGGRYLSGRAGKLGEEHDKKGNSVRGALYGGLAKQLAKPYERDFNLMNTKFGKDITGIAGLKGGWAGETKGKGLKEDDKKAAEGYAKRSEKAAESLQKEVANNKGTMLAEAARGIADLPENRERRKQLRTMEEDAKKQLDVSKKALETNKEALTKATENHDSEKSAAETAMKESEQKLLAKVSDIERNKGYAPESEHGKFDEEAALARAAHDSTMNREKAKITTARAEVARLASLVKADEDIITGAPKRLEDIAKQNREFEAKMEKEGKEAGNKVFTAAMSNVSADNIAKKLVPGRLTNIFNRGADNDHLTALTRKQIKETGDEKNIKKIIKKQVEESEKAEKKEGETEDSGKH